VTEAEWERSAPLGSLIEYAFSRRWFRKLRLFACGCVRDFWQFLPSGESRRLIEAVELFADSKLHRQELRQLVRPVWTRFHRGSDGPETREALRLAAWCADKTLSSVVSQAACPGEVLASPEHRSWLRQTLLFRDIFGNPFRPVAFDPSWRTSTAVALARQMYESRAFDRMPILADALEEAGVRRAVGAGPLPRRRPARPRLLGRGPRPRKVVTIQVQAESGVRWSGSDDQMGCVIALIA